jgi:ABC-type transport system substrate-binding protein
MPGHSTGIELPYDPDQADRLLAEAGYSRGSVRGFPVADLVVDYGADSVGRHLQTQWRENLGVEITWETAERGELLGTIDRKLPHMFIIWWMVDYPDPDNFLRLGVNFARHYTHWQNEAYGRLVEKARRTMNQEERIKLYGQADRILTEEAAIVPLAYARWHSLVKPWVSKFPMSAIKWWFWKDVVIEPH